MANQNRIKMMKSRISILVVFLLLYSCSKKRSHYRGYVFNLKNPLENVSVSEIGSNSTIVKTDSLGYFKLKKELSTDLVFFKKNYKTDTVKLLRLHPVSILFLRKQTDTMFMQKIKQHSQTPSDTEETK